MFGCKYEGDGGYSNNVQSLAGQPSTLLVGAQMQYTYGSAYPDQYVDYFSSSGGDIVLKSQDGNGRLVAYCGPDGTYRAIHSPFWFGAMKDAPSSNTKAQIMAAYMRFLKGDTLVSSLNDEISAALGGKTHLMIEGYPDVGGRPYVVLGSATGTSPGTQLGLVTLPLNRDGFMRQVYDNLNGPNFANFQGTLDAEGRAVAVFDTQGPVNPALAGRTLSFAALVLNPPNGVTNATEVRLVP